MSLLLIIVLSACTCAAFLITLSRIIGLGRVVKHGKIIDIVFTITLLFVFAGSLTGMLVAILAGLMMAVFLMLAGAGWSLGTNAVDSVRARHKRVQDEWTQEANKAQAPVCSPKKPLLWVLDENGEWSLRS